MKSHKVRSKVSDSVPKSKVDMNRKKTDFVCHKCSAAFFRKDRLVRHMKSHDPDLPQFKCDKCESEFTRKDTLTRHMKSHDDELKEKMISIATPRKRQKREDSEYRGKENDVATPRNRQKREDSEYRGKENDVATPRNRQKREDSEYRGKGNDVASPQKRIRRKEKVDQISTVADLISQFHAKVSDGPMFSSPNSTIKCISKMPRKC